MIKIRLAELELSNYKNNVVVDATEFIVESDTSKLELNSMLNRMRILGFTNDTCEIEEKASGLDAKIEYFARVGILRLTRPNSWYRIQSFYNNLNGILSMSGVLVTFVFNRADIENIENNSDKKNIDLEKVKTTYLSEIKRQTYNWEKSFISIDSLESKSKYKSHLIEDVGVVILGVR